MRNVCGSEFQTDGDENWKAHVQKSVLTNGWSGSWIAGACTYLLHLLQTRELWGLRIRLSLGSIPGPRGQVPKMRSRQTLISMCPKCSRCFRFFGHICRADPSQDHSRALYASTLVCPSTGGEDPAGRNSPGYQLSRMIIRPLNLGLATAQQRVQNITVGQTLVETATSLKSSG